MEKADALFVQFGASWSGVELLHESAERYLKGHLVACGWKIVKTHDLNLLLAVACDFNTDFAAYSPACQSLTEQFWEQHYPGGDLDEVGEDYSNIRNAVGEIISLIQNAKTFPTSQRLPP